MGQIFNINPSLPFAEELAKFLLNKYQDNLLELSKVRLLLPNRRACRCVQEAFLRVCDGKALILPNISPIADIEEEAKLNALLGDKDFIEEAFNIAPAVSRKERTLILARFILSSPSDYGIEALSAEQAINLASALGKLIDEAQSQNLSFDKLKDLVPAELSIHWQKTLNLLELITRVWPNYLKDIKKNDIVEHTNNLLYLQAKIWQKNAPKYPVIIAGSTGGLPAIDAMIKTILSLKDGMVVLSGLDKYMDDEAWAVVDPSHPQFEVKKLLTKLGISRHDVQNWKGQELSVREKFVSIAMLPAKATHKWQEIKGKFGNEAIDNIKYLICSGLREEALAIALIMREALQNKDKTAALVTSDRNLSRRVASELKRWGLEIDDSAGMPLSKSVSAIYLRLIVEMFLNNYSSVSLLALLKHPLCAMGRAPASLRKLARILEKEVLRGFKNRSGLPAIKQKVAELVAKKPDNVDLIDLGKLLDELIIICADFNQAINQNEVSLGELIAKHIALAEKLAASDEASGAERLWVGSEGRELANFINELNQSATSFGNIDGASYIGIFLELIKDATIRKNYGTHPRLSILGPMEARLQRPNIMIIGGLNEGIWPLAPNQDPWMSRPMRKEFGLNVPEYRIGISAHDFVEAMGADKVYLTRAQKVDGVPTVPSRWLMRFSACITASGIDNKLWFDEYDLVKWAEAIDNPNEFINISPPEPRPPLSARPRKMSATKVEMWRRDPYSVYAKYILKLKKLDELDEEYNVADYGNLVHESLEEFVNAKNAFDDLALDKLTKIGQEKLSEMELEKSAELFWLNRFLNTINWIVAKEQQRHPKQINTEIEGAITLNVKAGDFELFAKADRVDELQDGTLSIIDYKTGTPPSNKEVIANYAPQLPIEAAIAMRGGFKGIKPSKVKEMLYWHLKGDKDGNKEQVVNKDKSPEELVESALKMVENLVNAFDDEAIPYHATPRADKSLKYSDYKHLARYKEWSSGDGGGDE